MRQEGGVEQENADGDGDGAVEESRVEWGCEMFNL